MKRKIIAIILTLLILSIFFLKIANPKEEKVVNPTLLIADRSGQVDGEAIINHYGAVQARVIFEKGKIKDIQTLLMPIGESTPISEMSIPVLRSDIIKMQSLQVELVSGATQTSASYIQSVQSAIDKFNKSSK